MIAIPNMDMPETCDMCPIEGCEYINGKFTCPLIEIVQCKDCKWWNEDHKVGGEGLCENNIFGWSKPTDFCSYGERRNDVNNTERD